ncbi:U3 small nucleolar RNA-associated protein 13 [Varicellaria rhodocarpa]|nr:U3 small nucleolar RNA-associated protein 13 [Varicellaria rhodocarpa]
MNTRANTKTTFAPENVIQPIHTGGDVALESEGRILVTCLGEEALLTDLSTGKLLNRLEGDGEILTAIQMTPSASHVITCSRSLSMRIYSLQQYQDDAIGLNPTLQRTLKPHTTPVITAAIDQTGTLLATGGADGAIKVWDIRGGYVSHTFRGHTGVISALRFFEANSYQQDNGISKKNRKQSRQPSDPTEDKMEIDENSNTARFRLASGSEDGKIRIWDLAKRKAISTLDSHVSVVRAFDFSSRQNTLLSVSRDKTLILWDAQSWKVKRVVPVLEGLECAGFVRSGSLVYTGGENGTLRIWETNTGREVTQEQEAREEIDAITHILYNPFLDTLLCVHADQSIIFHSLESLSSTESETYVEPLPVLRRISGTHDEIIDLAYVTPERSLLALATNSENVRLVSLATPAGDPDPPAAAQYFGADVGLLQGHEDIIICLDVDWSGCWLATGAKDNTARLWRIDHRNSSYETFAVFTGHAESLGAISLPKSLPANDSAARSDPLSHPPSFLLTGSQDRTIKRWDTSSKSLSKLNGKPPRAVYTRKAHEKDINAIATNHTSTLFASASQDRTVKIWSTEEGEVQGILRGHRRGVWTVAFAPKDTAPISSDSGPTSTSRGFVLTGSGDKTVKIWSLNDYSCLRTLEGHTNSVLKVLWMPSSQQQHPPTHHDPDSDLDLDVENPPPHHQPSTKRPPTQIVSAGGDGLVKIWDVSTGECATTLDNHTDRIWALTTLPPPTTTTTTTNHKSTILVSGGADSIITFWRDTTSTTHAALTTASTLRLEQDQALQNHIRTHNYRDAITLALQLNHPARLLALFTAVVHTSPAEEGSLSGVLAVDVVLASLADEQLFTLLRRLRDWNTNARTAAVAQRVLWVLVKSYPAERFVGLRGGGERKSDEGKGGGPGLGEVLEGLRAYTERHFRRMEGLVDESYLIDYTLREMEEVGGGAAAEDVVMA